MKRALDHALAELLPTVKGLRAVIVSASPDGVIAWCWSRDGKPDIALGFAALERAASRCIDDLGASQAGRSLLLTAKDAWVAAWPLYEPTGEDTQPRLAVTTVFEGELQSGMVMVYGTRIRQHLREALDANADAGLDELRVALVERIVASQDPLTALAEASAAAQLEPLALTRLAQLPSDTRAQLLRAAREPS